MLKRAIMWSFVLIPLVLVISIIWVISLAFYVIHITRDATAFENAEPIQQLAKDVYERHRSIWQAQRNCIVFDEILFYKPRPGSCEFKNVEFSTVLTFDEQGFRKTRSSDNAAQRPPSKGRVIVLGDSQAMGWGVQDEETFAAVLDQEYGFEVFNLAVSSYGTARELLRLQKEFALQEDDVVVIQYHPNDFHENRAFVVNHGHLPVRHPEDLDRFKHTPQDYGIVQTTASVFFILKGKLIETIRRLWDRKQDEHEPHAETFLAVVGHFPFLNKAHLVVCEVNSYGQATSFAEDLQRLAGDRITVLKPTWEPGDFFRLDPHLTPRGHRHLARMIATAIEAH